MKFRMVSSDQFSTTAMNQTRDQIKAWLPEGSHFMFFVIMPGFPRQATFISSIPESAALVVLQKLLDQWREKNEPVR